ncbi:MAG: hypothetical protein O7G84_07040 [Gammaproteobacteria bacterium]|nr:hypothetical protein [Gammaproteobacteria bacterium]
MTSRTVDSSGSARVRQNWVIDPLSDGLFIIAAPLISLVWAFAFASWFGPEVVLTIFAVFNIAHHLPTFIRIYGDRDLLRRFRWSLLLGPVLPFSLVMGVVVYVVLGGHHIGNLLYLMMILVIWDPWHFLMQHYGFMRIYDRNNPVRRAVASRMDLMICGTWFVYIMVATLDWLPNLLYDTYRFHGFPILFLFDGGVYDVVQQLSFVAALAATVAYLSFLVWCHANGYFVSLAKVMLLVTTFGVMCFTYVPNPLITRLMPDWNFALGFAVLGMVHVTQYLAIVWKYNCGLSRREGAARPGMFQKLFSRGGWEIASAFVLLCLMYGFFLSNRFGAVYAGDSPHVGLSWFLGAMFALAFTSTLLHYYYDGFIWKMRHKENQQNLGMLRTESKAPTHSWWEGVSRSTPRKAFFRQCLYFVPPVLLLSVTFWSLEEDPIRSRPISHVFAESSPTAAKAALVALEDRLGIERKMIRIRPRSKHYTYQADLLYMISLARVRIAEQPGTSNELLREERRRLLAEAIASLERALELGPPYGHHEDRDMSLKDIELRLVDWRLELQMI